MQAAPQLDLDAHRGAGDLIGTTLALFARHALLFLSVTLVVVAPFAILVAVLVGGVSYASDDAVSVGALVASAALSGLMPVLVTALHVMVVSDLGEGRVPSVPQALRAAAPRFPRAIGAVVVYTALAIGGLILFVIPGVWVFVAGYFATQAAVMEGRGPLDAFRRSSELVDDRWWRTAGTLALGWLLLAAASYPVDRGLDALDVGVLWVVLYALVQVLTLSLSALFGTLMYFSLRAREEHPFGAAPVPTYLPPISPTPAAQPPADL